LGDEADPHTILAPLGDESDPATILAAVERDLGAFAYVPAWCMDDRDIVEAAVRQKGDLLEEASDRCRNDREIVLAAVNQSGMALRHASKTCQNDREIVLVAVKRSGMALRHAAKICQNDREIVLAAVKTSGMALQHASEACRADREIVAEAVKRSVRALQFASDELLEDPTFAKKAKEQHCSIKVSMLSGQSSYMVVHVSRLGSMTAKEFLELCCERFAITYTGGEELLHGSQLVPATAPMRDWPGKPCSARVVEYQMVVTKKQRQT